MPHKSKSTTTTVEKASSLDGDESTATHKLLSIMHKMMVGMHTVMKIFEERTKKMDDITSAKLFQIEEKLEHMGEQSKLVEKL